MTAKSKRRTEILRKDLPKRGLREITAWVPPEIRGALRSMARKDKVRPRDVLVMLIEAEWTRRGKPEIPPAKPRKPRKQPASGALAP